jgi:UDP-N-acetylglucosamine 2-epimerase (non-hydrolysing)/GDP/UDP-N,N'-diacetylbacillosamine 2-epimerase (hydrolysing)
MRKIMVITGTRAEYGILKPVLNAIKRHPQLDLSLLVTGMHLSHEFGYTVKVIENDGFHIDCKVDMLLSSDSKGSMAKSLGIGILGMVQAIETINPDIVLVCGDRSEPFAAAIASAYLTIPVAHLLGGDTVMGSNIDDSIRHAITKFAHIHFVATEQHAERIIKMGEEPWRVHVVGSPAIDAIIAEEKVPQKDLIKKFNLDLKKPIILVVQHPTTTNAENAPGEIRETLEAIVGLEYQTILIYPNADAYGRRMIQIIKEYNKKHSFIKAFKSIPHKEYLSLMRIASVMVGNSSSGIFEAPSFGLPVVNIGLRQRGRGILDNVIDVDYDREQIKAAIKKALYDEYFKEKVKNCKNPYGDGKASERIVKVLSEIEINQRLLQKRMTY